MSHFDDIGSEVTVLEEEQSVIVVAEALIKFADRLAGLHGRRLPNHNWIRLCNATAATTTGANYTSPDDPPTGLWSLRVNANTDRLEALHMRCQATSLVRRRAKQR